MGWSLNYQPTREPELLDEFLLIAGKALYLATSFEAKCRYVLRIAKLADHFEKRDDASATIELAKVLKDKMLCATIKELKGFSDIGSSDVQLLEKAKDARNYIAHECASFGPVSGIPAKAISARLEELRGHLVSLVAGDNVVSRWVYEIEEKEPAPQEIQKTYLERVERWVFGEQDPT